MLLGFGANQWNAVLVHVLKAQKQPL